MTIQLGVNYIILIPCPWKTSESQLHQHDDNWTYDQRQHVIHLSNSSIAILRSLLCFTETY